VETKSNCKGNTMTEYFNILFPGEKPNADTILKRMGEYDQCLLTKDTENLTSIPVDFNPSNILPSNMARVSKTFLEKAPVVIDYGVKLVVKEIEVNIYFRSSYQFYKYNRDIISEIDHDTLLSQKQIDFLKSEDFEERFNGSALTEIFWNLVSSHIKGIDKVQILPGFSMDWSAFQAFIMGDLERRKSKSNIITPAFGY
jgi:hypothetical protein